MAEPIVNAIHDGYVPRSIFVDFHKRTQRFACMVIHRRGGKTTACIKDLVDSANGNVLPYQRQILADHPHPIRCAYIAPLYKQAKDIAWTFLKKYSAIYPGVEISESELRVDFPPTKLAPNGGRVRLYGADNPDALRGIWLDGVILDEVGDMSPGIRQVISPTLGDYLGYEVSIGTPKGQNDFYDLVYGFKERPGAMHDPKWFFRQYKASETGLLRPEFLADERARLTKEMYAQEYECSFQAAILGAYFGEELEEAQAEGRITNAIYDPSLEVHTAWDLGHSNATAIWWYQQHAFQIRIIDYHASTKGDLGYFVSLLRDKAAGNRGYQYGRHYLPHDVEVKVLGMDRTRIATLRQLGLQNLIVVPKLNIDDGINAVRKIFPRCWFDATKCQDGLKALRQYHREFDESRKVFYERPCHDWSSDAADAFRYLAVGLREPRAKRSRPEYDNRWVY
jgi:phage terminase large subunit